jgi:serine/threonine protein kinase
MTLRKAQRDRMSDPFDGCPLNHSRIRHTAPRKRIHIKLEPLRTDTCFRSDVWSFGVVVYEIVARKEPHADADQMAIGLQIRDNGITPKIPEDCDPCLRELLEKCWQLDPEQRPTMEQICDILDKYMEDNNW